VKPILLIVALLQVAMWTSGLLAADAPGKLKVRISWGHRSAAAALRPSRATRHHFRELLQPGHSTLPARTSDRQRTSLRSRLGRQHAPGTP